MVRRYIAIVCITLLLAFTAEAATLDDAKLAIRTQDFVKAASILKTLARKGDKQAQYQMAVLYRNGQGTKKILIMQLTGWINLHDRDTSVRSIC